MKKLYSLFLLMILSACAFAQEPIESKTELSNSKAYTIQSSRCFLQVIDGGTCLYTSNGSASGVVTEYDEKSKNQQFAFINGGKNIFLYSVGAGKFVDKNGNLTDELTSDVVINVVEISATSSAYPINLNWGEENYLNTQESGQTSTGVIIDGWTTLDAGNEFQIIEAADFTDEAAIQKAVAYDNAIIVDTITYVYKYNGEVAYNYTQIQQGNAPLTITYDAPGTRIGVSCSDDTPASKEITESTNETVTYNYTIDASALPITPTTIENGKFADGTKWYYLSPKNTNNFCYSNESNESLYVEDFNGVHQTDKYYLYAFVGNPLAGFQIYNMAKGATKPLQGVESNSEVSFKEGSDSHFFIEEGTSDGQYRFNLSTNSNSYINLYGGSIELYTSEWYGANDGGSQFYVIEAIEEEVEQAQTGVLYPYPSYANNYTFRNGSAIESLQVTFYGTSADASIVIADGMETGKISLQDADGNVVATPTYSVNAEDPTKLDIVFDPTFNTEGNYVFVMPRGVVKGAVSGMPNNLIRWNYSFENVKDKIVTARIWKQNMSGYSGYSNWSTLPYETHDDGDYYTCKVKITGSDTFVLMDWMNAGSEKDTLKLQFNTSATYNNGEYVNDLALDDWESSWIRTSTALEPAAGGSYKGCYVYPTYSDGYLDSEYGSCCICCYTYETDYYVYILADWYMDDRYAYKDILDGKVHGSAFKDLNYTDADYPAYAKLPYEEETGTYDITVGIMNDSTIVLQNYTGAEAGESLKIVYNPENGSAISFNDQEIDEYGSSWITSSVIDGKSGGYYAYVGDYSNISYNAETKSGYAIISCYDDTTGEYPYIYVSFGSYEPTTAIKSVKTADETAGNVTIYNIAGQKISAPRKGVNIINGKKIMY